MAQRTLYTIGHSTHTWEAFVALLRAWRIEEIADVRTLPRSRRFPWFNQEHMAEALPLAGIVYTHIASLGGLRRPQRDSVNTGWQNERFQAYADSMQTPAFEDGLAELNERRRKRRVCVMCAESVWWRCHRRMIADAEVARGIPVRHIMSMTSAPSHELTPFAVVVRERGRSSRVRITYPGVDVEGRSSETGPVGPATKRARAQDPPPSVRTRRQDMPKKTTFAVGDHVEWNSEAGRVRGTILKKITAPMPFKTYTVRASKEEPQYLIRSDKTDHLAMHKGSALRKIRKTARRVTKAGRRTA